MATAAHVGTSQQFEGFAAGKAAAEAALQPLGGPKKKKSPKKKKDEAITRLETATEDADSRTEVEKFLVSATRSRLQLRSISLFKQVRCVCRRSRLRTTGVALSSAKMRSPSCSCWCRCAAVRGANESLRSTTMRNK